MMDLMAPTPMRCDVGYVLHGNSEVISCRGRHGRLAMVKLMLFMRSYIINHRIRHLEFVVAHSLHHAHERHVSNNVAFD